MTTEELIKDILRNSPKTSEEIYCQFQYNSTPRNRNSIQKALRAMTIKGEVKRQIIEIDGVYCNKYILVEMIDKILYKSEVSHSFELMSQIQSINSILDLIYAHEHNFTYQDELILSDIKKQLFKLQNEKAITLKQIQDKIDSELKHRYI